MRVQIFLAFFGMIVPAVLASGTLLGHTNVQEPSTANSFSTISPDTFVAYRGSGRIEC
jgi:hypothetical protein